MMDTMQPFESAVREHGPTVFRVCRAVLGARADAEDAWSETFLAALRAWPDLPAGVNVEAWLVRVAHRKAIDVTRARARRADPVPDPVPRDRAAGTPTPEDAALADDAALWSRVAALPDRQREAIAYHYVGGLTHVETADLIGVTPAAVRRAASDGLATLRRALTTPSPAIDPQGPRS